MQRTVDSAPKLLDAVGGWKRLMLLALFAATVRDWLLEMQGGKTTPRLLQVAVPAVMY